MQLILPGIVSFAAPRYQHNIMALASSLTHASLVKGMAVTYLGYSAWRRSRGGGGQIHKLWSGGNINIDAPKVSASYVQLWHNLITLPLSLQSVTAGNTVLSNWSQVPECQNKNILYSLALGLGPILQTLQWIELLLHWLFLLRRSKMNSNGIRGASAFP